VRNRGRERGRKSRREKESERERGKKQREMMGPKGDAAKINEMTTRHANKWQ